MKLTKIVPLLTKLVLLRNMKMNIIFKKNIWKKIKQKIIKLKNKSIC